MTEGEERPMKYTVAKKNVQPLEQGYGYFTLEKHISCNILLHELRLQCSIGSKM